MFGKIGRALLVFIPLLIVVLVVLRLLHPLPDASTRETSTAMPASDRTALGAAILPLETVVDRIDLEEIVEQPRPTDQFDLGFRHAGVLPSRMASPAARQARRRPTLASGSMAALR